MSRRRRWTTIATCALGLGVAAVGVWASWDLVLESWFLRDFDQLERDERIARIETLASCGGSRTSRRLAQLFADTPDTGGAEPSRAPLSASVSASDGDASPRWMQANLAALVTLRETLERSSDAVKLHVGETLAAHSLRLGSTQDAVESVREYDASWGDDVGRLVGRYPALLPPLLAAVEGGSTEPRERVVRVVRGASVSAGERASGLVAGLSLRPLAALLSVVPVADSPVAMRADALFELLERASEEHRDAEVRAVALAGLAFWGATRGEGSAVPRVGRAWSSDVSPLVRRAALRIAGVLGPECAALDLRRLLLEERDPAWLADVIWARALWADAHGELLHAVELAPDLVLDVPVRRLTASRPLDERERARLRDILETRKERDVRDAAGEALVAGASSTDGVEGLRVHEWGVWRDVGRGLAPVKEILADLPAFVHAEYETPEELFLADRGFEGEPERIYATTKPVVFFDAPRPLVVHVRVALYQGSPWTYFPHPTDRVPVSFGEWRAGVEPRAPRRDSPGGESSTAPRSARVSFRDVLDGLRSAGLREGETERRGLGLDERFPPWSETPETSEVPGEGRRGPAQLAPNDTLAIQARGRGRVQGPEWQRSGMLEKLRRGAPWCLSREELSKSIGQLGLAWRGLRVGFPEALEPSPPAVEATSWWRHVRDVRGALVATRGEADRCVLYDGAVSMPGPVRLAWATSARDRLLLAVRDFHEYPHAPKGWPDPGEVPTAVPAVFLVERSARDGLRGRVLRDLAPARYRDEVLEVELASLDLADAALRMRFEAVLVELGLTRDQALSLVRTWEEDLFETDGVRVITALPQWVLDVTVPLDIRPRPETLRRVGLVWRECDDLDVGVSRWGFASRDAVFPSREWTVGEDRVDTPERRAAPWESVVRTGVKPLESREADVVCRGSKGWFYRDVLFSPVGDRLAFSLQPTSSGFVRPLAPLSFTIDFAAASVREWSLVTLESAIAKYRWSRALVLSERFVCSAPGSDRGSHLVIDPGTERARPLPDLRALAPRGDVALVVERRRDRYRRPTGPGTLRLVDLSRGTSRAIFESDVDDLDVGAARLDDDGDVVAFEYGSGSSTDVFLLDVEAERLVEVSNHPGSDRLLHLSRDGRRVLFSSDRTRPRSVFLADLATNELVDLGLSTAAFDAEGAVREREVVALEWPGGGWVAVDVERRAVRPLPELDGAAAAVARPEGVRAAFAESGSDQENRLFVREFPW